MIVWPLPRPCHRWLHFWDPYLVWRHIFCNFTPRNYYIKTAVPKLFLFPFKLFFKKIKHRYENEQYINKIKYIYIYIYIYIILMKDKILKHHKSRLTKFPHVYELARHRIALSEHWMSLRVCWLSCSMCNVQWFSMEFNFMYTCNIALIL